MSLSSRVNAILAAVLLLPIDLIDENSSAKSIPQWDSLNHMKIILALEEEFDIRIEDEQIGELLSVSEILSVISQLVGSLE
jgi:acyl carrier protein